MARMTNEIKVLRYIAEHGSISYRQMMVDLWINSPRDVISRMRKKGYPLTEWTVRTKSGITIKRFGLKP